MDTSSLKDTLKNAIEGIPVQTFIYAVFLLLILVLCAKILLRVIRRILERSKMTEKNRISTLRAARIFLYISAVLITISTVGVDTSAVVTLISAISLGLTLALNTILSNMAGGVILFTSRPFTPGDFVKVGETSGTVQEIRLNYTRLLTVDGLFITVPNHEMSDTTITNYTRNGKRRLEITMSAAYSEPLEKVKKALSDAAEQYRDKLLPDPVEVWVTAYGDSNIDYTLYCWVPSGSFLEMKRKITEAIWENFTRDHIQLDYVRTDVKILREEP